MRGRGQESPSLLSLYCASLLMYLFNKLSYGIQRRRIIQSLSQSLEMEPSYTVDSSSVRRNTQGSPKGSLVLSKRGREFDKEYSLEWTSTLTQSWPLLNQCKYAGQVRRKGLAREASSQYIVTQFLCQFI